MCVHARGSSSCYDNRRAFAALRAAIWLSDLMSAHSWTGGTFYYLSRKAEKRVKRIFQGWKVAHTINSSTFTARNPIFSGRYVFFLFISFLVCVWKWLFTYQTARCVIWACLLQASHFCYLDNIILSFSYPVACKFHWKPLNTNFKQQCPISSSNSIYIHLTFHQISCHFQESDQFL